MHKFGAKEFSEDYVQDAYIRLAERSDKKKLFKDDKINKSYMYFTLRNTYIDNIRKQRNYREGSYISFYDKGNFIFKDKSGDPGSEILQKEKYDIILFKVYKEINSWHWYDVWLFSIYLSDGMSIRKLEKESGISYFSIFHTLKNCKNRLKLAVGEDWEDFKNADYRFIKL